MKATLTTIFSALLLVTMGCRTSVNTVENANKSGTPYYIVDRRVITDASLADRISIVVINTAESATGILRAQIELANLRNSIQSIYYAIEWFDGDGMLVSTASKGWKQQQFMPRETIALPFVAPSPRARDFKIKLMEQP